MRRIKLESSEGSDCSVTVVFNQTNLSDTINKFFGFLRANGLDEEIIKSTTRDVLDGKWTNNLNNLIVNQNAVSYISPLTITGISALTTQQYSTINSTLSSLSHDTLKIS